MKNLDFELPFFTRYSWGNDSAEMTWEQRFLDIRKAMQHVAIASVESGIKPVAHRLIHKSQIDFFREQIRKHGLHWKEGELKQQKINGRELEIIDVSFSKSKALLDDFERAINNKEVKQIGQMLGYPDCCVNNFDLNIAGKLESDPLWQIAKNTSELKLVKSSKNVQYLQVEEVENLINPMYHRMGILPFYHLPCSFRCKKTIQLQHQFMELGRDCGFNTEMNWIEEVLNWPVEWSLLHGVSEMKTPVFKMICNAPATAEKFVLKWKGKQYPLFGSKGVHFPFETPKRKKVTESAAYKRGLENPIELITK